MTAQTTQPPEVAVTFLPGGASAGSSLLHPGQWRFFALLARDLRVLRRDLFSFLMRSATQPKDKAPMAWPKFAMLISAPTFSGGMCQAGMITGST